jgi:hypothetical protein
MGDRYGLDRGILQNLRKIIIFVRLQPEGNCFIIFRLKVFLFLYSFLFSFTISSLWSGIGVTKELKSGEE